MIRRLTTLLPVVAGVLCLTFALLHMVPGDPVDVMLGESASAADRLLLKAQLGLDQPMKERLAARVPGWMKALLLARASRPST